MQIKNKVKSVVFVLAAAAVVALGSNSWAAYSSVRRSSFTASADLTAIKGKVNINLSFLNLSNNSEFNGSALRNSSVTWTVDQAKFDLGGWILADRYVLLESTLTSRSGRVQIYSDNFQALQTVAGLQRYDYRASTTNYGVNVSTIGLYPTFDSDNDGTLDKAEGYTIPLAWRVVGSTFADVNSNELKPEYRNNFSNLGVVSGPNQYHPWRYVTDYSQSISGGLTPSKWNSIIGGASESGASLSNYATVRRPGLGLQIAEETYSPDDARSVIYLSADFSNAFDKTVYKSNIVIEAITE